MINWKDSLKVGDIVVAVDTAKKELAAIILEIKDKQIFIHYIGWSSKWDEWIDISSPRIKRYTYIKENLTFYNTCRLIKFFLKKINKKHTIHITGFESSVNYYYFKKTTYKTIIHKDVIYDDLRNLIIEFVPKEYITLELYVNNGKKSHRLACKICIDEFLKTGSLEPFERTALFLHNNCKKIDLLIP